MDTAFGGAARKGSWNLNSLRLGLQRGHIFQREDRKERIEFVHDSYPDMSGCVELVGGDLEANACSHQTPLRPFPGT